MDLVYGSSPSSYMDCKVIFGDECFHIRRLRRWPHHLWKLLLKFNHLQDEY